MKVAKGHQPLMPYLILLHAEDFIGFTQRVFDAREVFKSYRDADSKEIMHAEVQINGCNILFADVTEGYDPAPANLFVYVEDAGEIIRKAINNGCEVIDELAQRDYGYSGGVRDPFGNVWWLTSMN
ncbi:VOC family protein [Niabella sp. CC-SYL272]|uniref:VOC family protein n=1 Tax=Niabella agricola TaxID=2891571 RepID=UPI001F308A3E|nr:VOC family protein [Niabella agricola]MCF3111576.1 VOC family protein [Niabella agricola]